MGDNIPSEGHEKFMGKTRGLILGVVVKEAKTLQGLTVGRLLSP